MKIDHIAIWTKDIEKIREFYLTYFTTKSGKKYENFQKGFSSYFLYFDSGARIELMNKKDISTKEKENETFYGLTHFAISVGNKEEVDKLTEKLKNDGYTILGNPRTTGDGYYESIVSDPEGNRIEITE